MIKQTFVYLLSFLFFYSCVNKNLKKTDKALNIEEEVSKPNIIIILIDDAGYVDFGFMGSKDLETPHINALAKSGVIFTDAHVSSTVCAPSRAGLITGKYQQRFGFEANHTGDKHSGDIGLSDDIVTMADIFKANNYETVAIGKWHLGKTPSDHPNKRGFNHFYGFLGGGRSYFPINQPSKLQMLQYNGKQQEFEGYLTDALGAYSVKFVETHKRKPFFMYLAYNAVHTPMEAKKVHLEKYKDHPRKQLAAMTWSLDENVGKLQNKLKELNLLNNTLIYFLSDNGGAYNNKSKNGSLKGWKGNEFEGGHRVPFLLSWPNQIKGNKKFDGLISSLDIFPTSIAAANIIKDENLVLDGVNLIPYLKDGKLGDPHEDLYWRKLEESGARVGDFKLVRLDNFGSVLYNLTDDISESVDLSQRDPNTLKKLNSKLLQWESKMSKPLWQEDEKWMEVTYHIHQQLMKNKKVLYTNPQQLLNKENFLTK